MKIAFAGMGLLLAVAAAAAPRPGANPPIAVPFTLNESGFVTLVIEDASGRRVRNLVSGTEFPAGDNVAWWDGLDDVGRDTQAASHAVYNAPGKFVAAGVYKVRGLVRPKLDVIYEMTHYTSGNPPWATHDKLSEWLANHTAPGAMLFVPVVLLRCAMASRNPQAGRSLSAASLVGPAKSDSALGLALVDCRGHSINPRRQQLA